MSRPIEWSDHSNLPERPQHSARKHEILEAYLRRYITVLTKNIHQPSLKLWLIDGFAGGGQYSGDKGEVVDGSPLIFLKTVDTMQREIQATRKNEFRINARYFFVEKDKQVYNFLLQLLINEGYKSQLDSGQITLINDACGDALPKIIDEIRNNTVVNRSARCIFLLDQYGYTQVPYKLLNRIFESFPSATEVLLTFETGHLMRYMSENDRYKTTIKNAQLDGIITEQIIAEFRDAPDHEKPSMRLFIEQTLAKKIARSSGAKFFNPFFITANKKTSSFLLIHLSSHFKARDEMNKTYWELRNSVHHYGYAGLKNFQDDSLAILGYDSNLNEGQQSFEFDFDEDANNRVCVELVEELPEIISEYQNNITVEELLVKYCNNTPASSEHFFKVLASLARNGTLEIIGEDGRKYSSTTIKKTDTIVYKWQLKFL